MKMEIGYVVDGISTNSSAVLVWIPRMHLMPMEFFNIYKNICLEEFKRDNDISNLVLTKSERIEFDNYYDNKGYSWRSIGDNLGNSIGNEALYYIRAVSQMCQILSPLDSGGLTIFDQNSGKGTIQNNIKDSSRIGNVSMSFEIPVSSKSKASTINSSMAQTDPISNGLKNSYHLETKDGIKNLIIDNAPQGTFTTAMIGTRVLVGFIGDTNSNAVIMGKLSYEDEIKHIMPEF